MNEAGERSSLRGQSANEMKVLEGLCGVAC